MFNGEAVRELRQKLGWSRQEFASYLGLAEEVIASWENGGSQPANEPLGALYRLAHSKRIPFNPFLLDDPSPSRSSDPFQEPRLNKVRMFVESRYSEPIDLSQAASAACLEPKYFSKFFRKKVGRPFSLWLASYRVEKATELLTVSEEPVSAVGYAVGFQSIRTFERAFKRLTGQCPTEYRTKRRPLSSTKTSTDET